MMDVVHRSALSVYLVEENFFSAFRRALPCLVPILQTLNGLLLTHLHRILGRSVIIFVSLDMQRMIKLVQASNLDSCTFLIQLFG